MNTMYHQRRPIDIMNYYLKFSHEEFIICTGYKAEVINKYFTNKFKLEGKEINSESLDGFL